MKINEVAAAVGITSKNIRFYEEQGLLAPGRDASNYRSYTDADVEVLRKIKLLRQLDIPLAEIYRLRQGEVSLSGMLRRHEGVLADRRENLEKAAGLCTVLEASGQSFDTLDITAAAQALEQHKKEGADFVDVKRQDRKDERRQSAVAGALLFILLMLGVIALVAWIIVADPPDRMMELLLFIPPVCCIIVTLVVLYQRLKEIRKGEEDDYSDY